MLGLRYLEGNKCLGFYSRKYSMYPQKNLEIQENMYLQKFLPYDMTTVQL